MAELTTKKEAYRILYWQFALIFGLAVLFSVIQGLQSGVSVLLGGLAYWLPTLLFVWRVFARTTARAAKQFLMAFFVGEVTKLFLSGILFVLIATYLPITLLSVLIGFIGAVMAFWIACILLLARPDEGNQ